MAAMHPCPIFLSRRLRPPCSSQPPQFPLTGPSAVLDAIFMRSITFSGNVIVALHPCSIFSSRCLGFLCSSHPLQLDRVQQHLQIGFDSILAFQDIYDGGRTPWRHRPFEDVVPVVDLTSSVCLLTCNLTSAYISSSRQLSLYNQRRRRPVTSVLRPHRLHPVSDCSDLGRMSATDNMGKSSSLSPSK